MRRNSLPLPCSLLFLLIPAGGAHVALGAPPGPVAGFHPVIVVEATYPGANAQTVADLIAAPIEQQVNGVLHQARMVSRCTNDGRYTLWLSFDSAVDLDITQVLVQNRVSLALPVLPDAVQKEGITVLKRSPGASLAVALTSPDARRDALFLGNYATLQIRDELARLAGVARVSELGKEDASLRIWLDPKKLAAYDLSAADVLKALREQNIQNRKKSADQPPVQSGEPVEIRLDTLGRLVEPKEFADIIVKTASGGGVIRLRDVAKVESGREPARGEVTFDGQPAAALAISLLPNAKPRDVSAAVRERMQLLKKKFPEGIDYALALDLTPKSYFSRNTLTWCLLVEPILPTTSTAERILECQNRYAEILRQTRGVQHVLTLPENPWALFPGGPCVVAIFDPDFKELDWDKTRQTIGAQLLKHVHAAVPRVRDLSGPAGPRLHGYPLDFALCGADAKAVREFSDSLSARLSQTGKISDVASGPKTAPRINLEIDRIKAKALGVSIRDILDVLEVASGSAVVGDTNPQGRLGKVQVQLKAPPQNEMAHIKQLQIRNDKGQMVPLSSIVTVKEGDATANVTRVDLRPAATISANPASGVSLAEARWLCETLAEHVRKEMRLPAGYDLVWLQEVPAAKLIKGELKADPALPALEVTVARPVTRQITDYQEFAGRIEAAQSVDLRARVTGYLENIHFKDGADVKKGDILFAVDARPYQAALDQAQANLRAAEAQRDLSKRNLERLRALAKAVGQADVDAADAAFQSATAQVDAAKAGVVVARLNVDFATVRAPIDGRIGRALVDPGNLVKADDTLVAKLVSVDPMYVYFDVDERTVLLLARKAKVKELADTQAAVSVGLADDTDFPLRGTCNFVDNRVDANTGTLMMRAVLPNKERLLRPGQFVRVRLPIGAPTRRCCSRRKRSAALWARSSSTSSMTPTKWSRAT